MRNIRMAMAVLLCSVSAANAMVTLSASGTSAKGVDVTFEAQLTLIDDTLTITLTNNSPVDSLNPDDVLGSFYFDIVTASGVRPTLAYVSAVGDTYKGVKDGSDIQIEAGADLRASESNIGTWQFKAFDAAYSPFLGFGIGTVGNSSLSPGGFNGNVVNGFDFGIYTGDITTQSLTNADVLVKDSAIFVFSGLAGFDEADISPQFAFGLGTAPDSLLVPEPATLVLLGLGSLLLWKHRSP